MSEIPSDPELSDIESALKALAPAASRLDRDQLMFQAGTISVRSARHGGWGWPSIAAALAVALGCESLILALRPGPQPLDRVVVVQERALEPLPPGEAPRSSAAIATPGAILDPQPQNASGLPRSTGESVSQSSWTSATECQRLSELVLRFGLDALPERPPLASQAVSSADSPSSGFEPAGVLRRIELEKLSNPGDPS